MDTNKDDRPSGKTSFTPSEVPRPSPKRTGVSPVLFFVLSGVGFVLSAVVFALLSQAPPKKPFPAASVAPAAETKAAAPASVVPAPRKAVVPKEKKQPPSLSLSGILYSPQGSMALINGRVIPEGGLIEGARVEKISSDVVQLNFEGDKIILRSR